LQEVGTTSCGVSEGAWGERVAAYVLTIAVRVEVTTTEAVGCEDDWHATSSSTGRMVKVAVR